MKARRDWQARIHRPSGEVTTVPAVDLPPPGGLRATPGRGCVTLTWEPVPGATGYLVERSPFREGPYAVTGQPDVDVPAVPSCRYVDTGQDPCWYRVSAVGGPAGSPVHGSSGGPAVTKVEISGEVARELPRPWRFMIGSEHLSYLLEEKELIDALRLAHTELGVATVRAHAILDEVRILPDGYDFSRVDQVYDTITGIGLRPIVELSFMPQELASDPTKTGLRLRGDHQPPEGLGRLGRPGPRLHPALRRPLRPPGTDRPLGLRGLERTEPGGLLVRHAGRLLPPVRDQRRRREGRAPLAAGGRPVVGGQRLGRGAGRPGPTGRLRLHPHLRQRAVGLAPRAGAPRPGGDPDLVDRMGPHPRPTSTASATARSARRSCSTA